MNSPPFKVGELVELDFRPAMVLGTGTIVKIIEIHSDEFVTITTGCGQWCENINNLRKIE